MAELQLKEAKIESWKYSHFRLDGDGKEAPKKEDERQKSIECKEEQIKKVSMNIDSFKKEDEFEVKKKQIP